MKVVLSGGARRDLTEIGDHIAVDNPLRAATFVDELETRCVALDPHPQRFPIVGKLGSIPVRKMTHTGYVVLYASGTSGSMCCGSSMARGIGTSLSSVEHYR